MMKFKLIFTILFIITSLLFFAQSNNLNKAELNADHYYVDSIKVDSLINLSTGCFRTTPLKAIEHAKQAKEIAENIGYTKGVALALKYIGVGYYVQADWMNVITNWQQSIAEFEKIDDKVGVSNMLNNLGAINNNEGDDNKALELFLQSLKISEEINDTLRIASALMNIGLVYLKKTSTLDKSEEILNRALSLSKAINYDDGIGVSAVNLGEVFYLQENYQKALPYFELALETFQHSQTGNIAYALNYLGKVYAKLGEFNQAIDHQQRALEIAKELNANMEVVQSLIGLAGTYEQKGSVSQAISYYNQALPLAQKLNLREELRNTYDGLAKSFAYVADFKNAYRYQSSLIDIKDTLFKISNEKKIGLIQLNFENEKKQGKIDLLTKDRELQKLEMQRQRLVKNTFLVGLILIVVIAFIIFKNYRAKVKVNKLLDKQKVEIENLVLNILPAKIAKELRIKGSATPRNYKSVSVLFADFKDFTLISDQLSPAELVSELNDYFMAFDNIVEKFNLEKIKTIGDAYMCAGGLPTENDTHPIDTVKAAMEMQNYMDIKNKQGQVTGKVSWGLRVGIHTGPILAGVVGRKKYAYDIWGSTVNVASRMESNGEVGKVNISAATFELVKDQYKCLYRGKISAKNVGEIDMHFIDEKIIKDKIVNIRL